MFLGIVLSMSVVGTVASLRWPVVGTVASLRWPLLAGPSTNNLPKLTQLQI